MATKFYNPENNAIGSQNGDLLVPHTNGVNGVNGEDAVPSVEGPRPLNIAIVGAGIGGLAAAIGLRKNGHNVSLYEQSQFANEVGAAIHLAPNANGILRRWGLMAEEFGAVEMCHLLEFDEIGNEQRRVDLREPNKLWQHPWMLVHRVKLHDRLKLVATGEKGEGPPVKLNLSSRVASIDPENCKVVLEKGDEIQADVIIGADGIYSKTREALTGEPPKLFSSGKAAFRCLVPRKIALEDPVTRDLFEKNNELIIWYGADRRVVMYPCDDNELLNFVCIHPEEESQGGTTEWNKQGSVEQLLKVYHNFDPRLLALISKVEVSSLKVWKLLDMEILPTWIKGKFTVLGDAAHPFLPHQGQGAGIAIEDGACLSVVLPFGTKPEEVAERLQLFEKIRYERANKIQEFSRQAGKDFVDGKPVIDMMKYTAYNFGHDEIDNSNNKFLQWRRSKCPNMYQRSPVSFGPAPGPRQDIWGNPQPSLAQTFLTASVKVKTSATFLKNLFPTESFSFKSTGSVAYCSFSTTTLGNMTWLGGGGYNHFGLYIHGVQYTKKDGTTIDGTYMPVLFESLTDPIVSGRDELGMPKVYCAIDIHRRSSSYRMAASWQGAKFLDIALEGLQTMDPATEKGTIGGESDYGILVYRYVPAVGREMRGKADAEYAVVVPHEEESRVVPSTVKKVELPTKATVKFDKLDFEALPTLHHIVSVLADIPIYEVVGAKVVEGTGVPDVSSARRIE